MLARCWLQNTSLAVEGIQVHLSWWPSAMERKHMSSFQLSKHVQTLLETGEQILTIEHVQVVNLSKESTTVQNWGDHANCPGEFSNTKQSKEHRIHWECHGIQDGDFNQRSCANGHINIVGTNSPKRKSQDTYANKYIQDKKDGKHHIANFDDELPSRQCLQCRAIAWL